MKKIALLAAALAVSFSAHAANTSEYTTVVRWVDSHDITQFQGDCSGRFGPIGVDGPLAIDLRCPNYGEANVILYGGSRASMNGKPARATYPVSDTVTITTPDGELTFLMPDCTKDAC